MIKAYKKAYCYKIVHTYKCFFFNLYNFKDGFI